MEEEKVKLQNELDHLKREKDNLAADFDRLKSRLNDIVDELVEEGFKAYESRAADVGVIRSRSCNTY